VGEIGNKAKRRKFYLLMGISILILLGIAQVINPITFRLPFSNKLTPRIICIDNVTRDGREVTIMVEVEYNHWKAVEGAGVSIYGYGASDTNYTNESGIAIIHLHLNFAASSLAMSVWKDNKIVTKDPAIKIVRKGGYLEWHVIN